MSNKECRSCVDYDDGLCDRSGFMVDEDDTCNKYRDRNMPSRAAGDDQKRREGRDEEKTMERNDRKRDQ